MATIKIINARQEHAHYHELIRECDRTEVKLASGNNMFASLSRAIMLSGKNCWIGFNGHTPFGIWGVTPMSELDSSGKPMGSPWFLGTNIMDENKMVIAKRSKFYIDKFFDSHNFLLNYVHKENYTSIKWLEWMGFSICKAMPYGPYHAPFRMFMMNKEVWRMKNV